MKPKDSGETRSFRDPMAARVEAALKHREAEEGAFPSVKTVYDGFYVRQHELTEEGTRFFLGAEGIIGSKLAARLGTQAGLAEPDTPPVLLSALDGRILACLEAATSEQLARYLKAGWHVTLLLSATFFRAQDKGGEAELACICWAPEEVLGIRAYPAALANFSHHIAERLAKGDRAGLSLSQEQFINLLRSGGEWFLTPTTKREPPPKGTVLYKSHRSGTERITGYALKHRTGCTILASLFWILLIGGITALIWFFFSS